jgi:hypothetical protein
MATWLREVEVAPEYWIPKVCCYKPNGSRHQGTTGTNVEAAAMILATEHGKKLNPW